MAKKSKLSETVTVSASTAVEPKKNSDTTLLQLAIDSARAVHELERMTELVSLTTTPRLAWALTCIKPLEKATKDLYDAARAELIKRIGDDRFEMEQVGNNREITVNGKKVTLSLRETMKEKPGAITWLKKEWSGDFSVLTKTTISVDKAGVEAFVKAGHISVDEVRDHLFTIQESWMLTTRDATDATDG